MRRKTLEKPSEKISLRRSVISTNGISHTAWDLRDCAGIIFFFFFSPSKNSAKILSIFIQKVLSRGKSLHYLSSIFCRLFLGAFLQIIVYGPGQCSPDSMFSEEWKQFSHGNSFIPFHKLHKQFSCSPFLIIHFLSFSGFQSFSFFALVGVCLSPHYSFLLCHFYAQFLKSEHSFVLAFMTRFNLSPFARWSNLIFLFASL